MNRLRVISLSTFGMVCLCSLLLGFRDLSIGTDSQTYASYFLRTAATTGLMSSRLEVGFMLLMKVISFFTTSVSLFFAVIAFISTFLLVESYKLINSAPGNRDSGSQIFFLSMLLFSSWWITEVTNGLRQGIALAIIYFAIIKYLRVRSFRKFTILFLVSASFHVSTLLILPFILFYFLPLTWIALVWGIAGITYYLGFNEIIVMSVDSLLDLGLYQQIKNYAVPDNGGVAQWSGFSYLFFGYTVFWPIILFGATIYFSKFIKDKNQIYESLRIYLILCLPYFIFGFAGYSNRYAVIAWLFIPFLQVSFISALNFKKYHKLYIYTIVLFIAFFYFMVFRLRLLS
ncbi:MAG: EpsG family protein [Methylococcales bacterium]|nr:EpsG family protein [Methylococcales bacterium]